MKKFFLAIACAATLVGCGEKINDVDFYKKNPTEMDKTLKQCELGKAAKQNCDNAQKAKRILWDEAHSYKG